MMRLIRTSSFHYQEKPTMKPMTKPKKRPAKKATAKKKATPRKPSRKKEPRPYVEPKTAAELGITCTALVAGVQCGAAVVWFDYELGERSHMSGFVCDAHKVSERVEKLAVR